MHGYSAHHLKTCTKLRLKISRVISANSVHCNVTLSFAQDLVRLPLIRKIFCEILSFFALILEHLFINFKLGLDYDLID